MSGPVIFCPLEIESRALLHSVGARSVVVRTGPGGDSVRRGVEHSAGAASILILAGLAGGLEETELVPRIGRVVDSNGASWTPTVDRGPESAGLTIVGVDRVLIRSSEKLALAQSTSASLVDCESHAFAAAAESSGAPWAIVRGVSDGPEDELPGDIDRWVDASGRARTFYVAGRMARSPWLIPSTVALARRSKRVLRLVAARVAEILNDLERNS